MKATPERMLTMLKLQDEMNSIVNPEWRSAGYNWSLAIMVEAVEAIERHGWKWWKKQTPDMAQVRMELVDIWHFTLSLLMVKFKDLDEPRILERLERLAIHMADKVNEAKDYPSNTPLLESLQFMAVVAAAGNMNVIIFAQVMDKAGMTWDDLYAAYISKNCLNRFRQARGYKTGDYIKDWSDAALTRPLDVDRALEDNDHLCDIMSSMDIGAMDADLPELITKALEDRYAIVTGIIGNAKFEVGDKVTFINEYGVKFPEREITGIDPDISAGELRYFFAPHDAHWMSAKESRFIFDADDAILAEAGGHKIRHTAIPISQDSDKLWFMVGTTGGAFKTIDLAIKFAEENPISEAIAPQPAASKLKP